MNNEFVQRVLNAICDGTKLAFQILIAIAVFIVLFVFSCLVISFFQGGWQAVVFILLELIATCSVIAYFWK